MKKLALTIAIVLGIGLVAYAQNGGLFGYGEVNDEETIDIAWYSFYQDQDDVDNGLFGILKGSFAMPGLPSHGQDNNQNAPLGGGTLLLIGFGATYAFRKRKKR